MRMRKKKNLDTRIAHCADWLVCTPEEAQGRWRELYAAVAEVPLYLEIGCGKGQFTVKTAESCLEALYIAIERVPDAMVIAMERAKAKELRNVCFIDADAANLEEMFAPEEIDRIYINFCDPWPSNKHARRRLTHVDFLARYYRVLKPGGEIHFKTDNGDLFEYSLFQFPKEHFSLQEVTRNLHQDGVCGVMTDYEEKFHQQNIPINRCVAVKDPK